MEKSFEDFLSFRGMRVHYRVDQPENGNVRRRVLLLNGPMSSMFNWRLLVPSLLSLDTLVAQIDLPGYGQSDCGRGVPQDAQTRAQLAWGVLDEIDAICGDTSQYWHLISHGSSCLTTLTMAQQAPECVASNVFISPLLHVPLRGIYRFFHGRNTLERALDRWYHNSIVNRVGFLEQANEWFGRTAPEHVIEPMRRSLNRSGMRHQLIRLLDEGFQYDPQVLQSFTPMMAIWGQMDPLFTAADAAEFKQLLPDAETHVLHTAAHYPQETHSRAICDYLRGWLRYIDP